MNTLALPILRRWAMRLIFSLLILSALYDVSTPLSFCFSPSQPLLADTLPLCFHDHFRILIKGIGRGGFPGLVWHFLPAIVVTALVIIVWVWKDLRRARA